MHDPPLEPDRLLRVTPIEETSASQSLPGSAASSLVWRATHCALLALLLLLVLGAIALAAPSQPRWHPLLALAATVLIVSVAIIRGEGRLDRTALRTVIGLAWIAFVLTGLFGLKTPAILATAVTLYGWICLARAPQPADGLGGRRRSGPRVLAVASLLSATAANVLCWLLL